MCEAECETGQNFHMGQTFSNCNVSIVEMSSIESDHSLAMQMVDAISKCTQLQ